MCQLCLVQDSAGQLQNTLQDVFCSIEQVWEGGHHSIGPAHLFFQLLDDSRATLPVSGGREGEIDVGETERGRKGGKEGGRERDGLYCLQEQSVLHLVLYHTQVIDSTDLDWLQQITDFMDKFYRYIHSHI